MERVARELGITVNELLDRISSERRNVRNWRGSRNGTTRSGRPYRWNVVQRTRRNNTTATNAVVGDRMVERPNHVPQELVDVIMRDANRINRLLLERGARLRIADVVQRGTRRIMAQNRVEGARAYRRFRSVRNIQRVLRGSNVRVHHNIRRRRMARAQVARNVQRMRRGMLERREVARVRGARNIQRIVRGRQQRALTANLRENDRQNRFSPMNFLEPTISDWYQRKYIRRGVYFDVRQNRPMYGSFRFEPRNGWRLMFSREPDGNWDNFNWRVDQRFPFDRQQFYQRGQWRTPLYRPNH